MLSAVRKADGPCPVAASVTTTVPEDAVRREVAGPIAERPSPIGPAEESVQHKLKPIVALMPKTHLILRLSRIYSLTIQPARHQVKKPYTQNPPRLAVDFDGWGEALSEHQRHQWVWVSANLFATQKLDRRRLIHDACQCILIRMVKEIRPPRHAELGILLVMKPVLVENRHRQFVTHRLELLVEEPI